MRVLAALALVAVGAGTAGCPALRRSPGRAPEPHAACADRCALPHGLDLATLDAPTRAAVAARALLCADLECGRITRDEYVARTGGVGCAPATAAALGPALPPDVLPPPARWATDVRAFSSEYTADTWSARKVLGPPDVWPKHGDDQKAWASLSADGGIESIEVAFGEDFHAGGLEVYETYNPGAITRVELLGAAGESLVAHDAPAVADTSGKPHLLRLAFGCTPFAVHTIRLTLDSKAVPGWNEIDAIGVVPCVGAVGALFDWLPRR